MPEIFNPEDPESHWLVSRTRIIEEHYFATEREAREFAIGTGMFVEPPEWWHV